MLTIGPLTLQTNLLLAPIAGYCDLAFRIICRSFNDDPAGAGGGLGLACTDLLSPQGLLRGTATSLDLAKTNDLDRPVGMQLYGCDPAIMADGARWAIDHGASLVDINMGCPVDKVTKKDGGSKLLCDVGRAERIVEAVVRAIAPHKSGVPVTAKLRLGWTTGEPVAARLAPRLVEAGAAAITVHGRFTDQKFKGGVDHAGIAAVVESVGGRAPVIGNGDVKEASDVAEMIGRTGCSGVMIGRGALSTPWLFRDAWALLRTGNVPEPPDEAARISLVARYFDLMRQFRGDHYAMVQVRRRISWFAKRLGPCRPLREAVRLASGPGAVHAALGEFLAGGLRGGNDLSRSGVGEVGGGGEEAAGRSVLVA